MMDKTKILEEVKQTAFFKSLTENSRERLLRAWPTLNDDQMTKIVLLAGYEKLMVNFIVDQASPLIEMAQKESLRDLTKKLEKSNTKDEEEILNDFLNKIK